MRDFPFELSIDRADSSKHRASLSCTALLRTIPGKRDVYDAVWDGRRVIVKVFSRGIGARRRLRKEWRGLTLLQERGLSAPAPLFYGKTIDRRWAIVQEEIMDSSTVLEVLERGDRADDNVRLLAPVFRVLAAQHAKGVLQKDLHPGNFLLGQGKLFALDAGRICFFQGQIGRRKSLSQLALLARSLAETDEESISSLYGTYFEARGWTERASDKRLLRKYAARHRRSGIRNGLKKCLRTSRRHSGIRTGAYTAVFSRSFCPGHERDEFIEQIDALMDSGQILKDGRTCYVSRIRLHGKELVVKRYNHLGLVHSLRHSLKGSRARRNWLHAHRLMMLRVPTPHPLAYIERRRGGLVWTCYIVTEYVAAPHFEEFLRRGDGTEEARAAAAGPVLELLERLAGHGITHGDLKHTNILVTETGPMLTDLDGMKVHLFGRMCRRRHAKDIESFSRRGRDGGI
ncbi:MAG: hypothetical protein JSU94_21540 [Phycisphaerales bacterium]|nr:MAG: hypothetical protein JSU94_21540 [Phycisphaerales bacterium]